jgi:hypothetical protein
VDFIPIHYPNAVYRSGLIANLTLRPGETREFECRASDATFYNEQGKQIDHTKIWSGWIDIRVDVIYRGRDGLYSRVVLEASLI